MLVEVSTHAAIGRLVNLVIAHEDDLKACGDPHATAEERKSFNITAKYRRAKMRTVLSAFNGTIDPSWPPMRDATLSYLAAYIMDELQAGQRRARSSVDLPA